MFAGAVAIFAMVMTLLALACRGGAGQGEPANERAHVRFWIIGLGLVFSLGVLMALLTYGVVTGERLLPREHAVLARVGAHAERWIWKFTYNDRPGFVTEGTLYIPAGRPVDVAITTGDVIHSFWVPRLAGKLDAIPGRVNVLRIQAERPGRYHGASAEFSGEGYAVHTFVVVAHDANEWRRFIAGSAP